jgi:hypothetical protein
LRGESKHDEANRKGEYLVLERSVGVRVQLLRFAREGKASSKERNGILEGLRAKGENGKGKKREREGEQ